MIALIQNHSGIKYIGKAILCCMVFTALLFVFSSTIGFLPDRFERLGYGVVGTVAALLATALFLKFDGKQFPDAGLSFERTTVVKFFAGVLIGLVVMGLLATGVLFFSDVTIAINPQSNVWRFLVATLPLFPLALMEELGFRAYPLVLLQNKAGTRLSIIITSILFALYHLLNGWTIAAIAGPAIWGLVFGLAAVWSRGIALSTGIHYAANLTTAAFGSENTTATIWTVKQTVAAAGKQQEVNWSTIFSSLILLVVAVVCIELYLQKKNAQVPERR